MGEEGSVVLTVTTVTARLEDAADTMTAIADSLGPA